MTYKSIRPINFIQGKPQVKALELRNKMGTTITSSLTHFMIRKIKTSLHIHPNTTPNHLFKTQHSSPSLLAISMSTNGAQSNSNATSPPSNPTKTVRVMIKGRVQGVFYRNWTVENARELGLKGWVRNRRDGSVEALFSGVVDSVDEMQQRCRRGPPEAMVTGFQAFPSSDDPGLGFDRKPTV